jgi:flagellar basal-body rod modification protein FlgD
MEITPILPPGWSPEKFKTTGREPAKTLGQADFLKLLTTQFAQQDPMEPMKDTAFIAQMAQFTSLEQTKSMSVDMAALREQQEILQATGVLGRSVEVQVDAKKGTTISGVVTGIHLEAGTPKLMVNGKKYDFNQITAIAPEQPAEPTPTP